jgi:hypothetical protein
MMTEVHNPELDKCSTCGQTRTWHRNNRPRHPFAPYGTVGALVDSSSDRESIQDISDDRIVHVRSPMDPVLRQALMDKGVLTIEDLEQAERKIALLSEHVRGGDPDG